MKAAIDPDTLNDLEKQSLLELVTVLQLLRASGTELPTPNQTRDFLRLLLAERKAEIFGCLFLDNNRHWGIDTIGLFQGTIDSALVYPAWWCGHCF